MQFPLRVVQTLTKIIKGPGQRLIVRVWLVTAHKGLETVTGWIPCVDGAATRHTVTCRTDVHRHLMHRHDVTGTQYPLPTFHQEGAMMQFARLRVLRKGNVMHFVGTRQPYCRLAFTIFSKNSLNQIEAQYILKDLFDLSNVWAVQQCVVQTDRGYAALGVSTPGSGINRRNSISDSSLGRIKLNLMTRRKSETDPFTSL